MPHRGFESARRGPLASALRLAALALVAIAAVVVVRTARLASRQPPEDPPLAPIPIEAEAVARRLAAGIRFATISESDPGRIDAEAFRGLHALLEQSYPRVDRVLDRELVGGLSLLYTWRGRDAGLPPVVLAAHLDVVPVDAESEGDWTHPPFAGAVADGFVWGRGALDDKGSLFGILEAVEGLLAEGFEPQRTLLLAFGHDEELGGKRGAARIAALLGERGLRPAFVLDEGGVVAEPDTIPGLGRRAGAIGVAEKGSVSIALEAHGTGGHSSTPPRSTAVGLVAAAVAALENHPMPARVDGTTELFFDHLGPELGFPLRAIVANRWLFAPLLESVLARTPATDAMLRTTTAATLFSGGIKDNVLPIRARAIVNFRIHPDDSIGAVEAHVRRVVRDERIAIEVGAMGDAREPSAASPVDSEAFAVIARTLREVFPEALALPFLVLGGTDARHYAALTPNLYRFLPFELGREALEQAHGTDERLSLENLVAGIRFYRRLIERAVGPPGGV